MLYSTSKRPKNQYTYQFSWDERDPENPLYGGFEKGLTYQLVVLHIITCYLGGVYQRSERCGEVVECWFDLVRACDAGYPRTSAGSWSERVIEAACRDPRIQPFIERVCDALWFAMRYQLPDKNINRKVRISEGQVLPTQEIGRLAATRAGVGSDLLSPEWGKLVPEGILMQQESGASPKNTPARQARLERELSLDEQFLSTLSETRESRIVDPSPSWILPEGDDEIF